MKKIVFSSTLNVLEWNNSELSTMNLIEEVNNLKKAEGKNIMIIGSASIVQKLTEQRFIDEYKFFLFPVILGDRKPLFRDLKTELNLKLSHSESYENGTLILTYSKKKRTTK